MDIREQIEKVRYIETQLQLIKDMIEKYKKEKVELDYLINYLERIINDIKTKDEKIADTLHDIWLDPYVINKMYTMRQRPEIDAEEHLKIKLSLDDMIDYIKNLPLYKTQ